MAHECPNCGSPIEFQSKVSVYGTCGYCQSTVVRTDLDLELMGKQSFLIDDMSPYQIGTRGKYENKDFTMLGRIKLLYDGGFWNEWYLLFSDGSEGWFSDAQGFFMISFKVGSNDAAPSKSQLMVGNLVEIAGQKMEVDDIRTIEYAAAEGELPFIFRQGFDGLSVDLRGSNGQFGNVLYGPDETEVYVGKYLPFESFKFTNLKKIHGWD